MSQMVFSWAEAGILVAHGLPLHTVHQNQVTDLQNRATDLPLPKQNLPMSHPQSQATALLQRLTATDHPLPL